jgi:hypothetical protein
LSAFYELGGENEEQFWRFTPRLFRLWIAAKTKAAKSEREFSRWCVWHAAALPRAKDFPDLGLFVTGVKTPTRRQTPEEIEAVFHAMFGPPPEDA